MTDKSRPPEPSNESREPEPAAESRPPEPDAGALARSLAESGLADGVRKRRKDWARLAALLLETLKAPRAPVAEGDAALERARDILTRIAASQLTQKLVHELVRLLAEKGVVSELVGEVVVASMQTIAAAAAAQKREPKKKKRKAGEEEPAPA